MSYNAPPDTVSADDRLPPVEPPSAGFIVQLFVIPALIVVIMLVVGAGIKWLVERDNDPDAYVAALGRDSAFRWQAANDLAELLRNPRYAKLKDDAHMAKQLADILNREIDQASFDEKAIKLRVYLCHLLGEFHAPDVLDVLLKAAKTERSGEEATVRFAALKGLAVWLDGSAPTASRQVQKVLPTLLAASRDEEPLLRSTAAFALGASDDAEAQKRLKRMLVDRYPDVRYNAATMLARRGDAAAADVLAEMLNAEQIQALEKEAEAQSRNFKRHLILVNALRAAKDLALKNKEADLSQLTEAVKRLTAAELPGEIRVQAKEVLLDLNQRGN